MATIDDVFNLLTTVDTTIGRSPSPPAITVMGDVRRIGNVTGLLTEPAATPMLVDLNAVDLRTIDILARVQDVQTRSTDIQNRLFIDQANPQVYIDTYLTSVVTPKLDEIIATQGGGTAGDLTPVIEKLDALTAQMNALRLTPNTSLNALRTSVQTDLNALRVGINTDMTVIRDNINANTVTISNSNTSSISAQLEACCTQMVSIVGQISASVGVELTVRVDDILALVRGIAATVPPDDAELVPLQTTTILLNPYARLPVPARVYDIEVTTIPAAQDQVVSDPLGLPGLGWLFEIDINNTPYMGTQLRHQRQRLYATSDATAGLLIWAKPQTVVDVTPYTVP